MNTIFEVVSCDAFGTLLKQIEMAPPRRRRRPNYSTDNTCSVLQLQWDFGQTEDLSVPCKICSVRQNVCESYTERSHDGVESII